MKNLKEIFNKSKFLITLTIGVVLMILSRQIEGLEYKFGYGILGIAVLFSVLQFRFYFDEKYKKKAIKRYQEQKKLPWQSRYASYPIFDGLITLWLLSLFFIGVTLVYFFHTGITTGVWKIGQTIVFTVLLLLVFIATNNTFKKK